MFQEYVKKQKDMIRKIVGDIHTAMPGTIEEIDYDKGVVSVLPCLKKKLSDGTQINYPLITGVPLFTFSCNSTGVSVTLPIAPGDFCWIMIAEQSLDLWLYGMDTGADMPFNLTNAVCIPGLSPKFPEDQKEANESGSVIVRAKEQALIVSPNGIRIEGSLHVTGDIVADGSISASNEMALEPEEGTGS